MNARDQLCWGLAVESRQYAVTNSEDSHVPAYRYENGRFWELPERIGPDGDGWALTSDFVPPVEHIIEINRQGEMA